MSEPPISPSTRKIGTLLQSALKTGRYLIHLTQTSQAPRSFFKSYAGFVIFMAALSLGMFLLVKVRIETYHLGYEMMELTREKERLEEQLHSLRAERARLRSPSSLLQMNKAMGLYLLPPEKWLDNVRTMEREQ